MLGYARSIIFDLMRNTELPMYRSPHVVLLELASSPSVLPKHRQNDDPRIRAIRTPVRAISLSFESLKLARSGSIFEQRLAWSRGH